MTAKVGRPLILLLLSCSLATAGFNLIHGEFLLRRYPVPGKFCSVHGFPMHIYCTGTGSPTVLLEAGGGDDWIYWQKVQPEISKSTRVCSYDRAGLGWSDLQAGPRDAKNIADQLHALLIQANESGSLILVGGSAGGFYVRQFAATYPSQVRGLVFVDSSVPEQFQKIPGSAYSESLVAQKHHEARWQRIKEASGWALLTGNCKNEVEKGLEPYADMARAEVCHWPFKTSAVDEWDEFWNSGKQAAEANCCGNLPVVIISQDPDRSKVGWSAQMIAVQPIWNSLQESLKGLSPNSRRIIARNSRHHVMIDRPDVVIRSIQRLVTGIRSNVSDPEYGTTVIE